MLRPTLVLERCPLNKKTTNFCVQERDLVHMLCEEYLGHTYSRKPAIGVEDELLEAEGLHLTVQ